MEENDDCAQARKAADGDVAVYAVLIERYQAACHAFVVRFLGNNETDRELTQDVCVKAWFALPRGSGAPRKTADF